MPNPKNNPPYSRYQIKQMAAANEHTRAQAACDANVEWFETKAAEYRDLWRSIQIRKMGNVPVKSEPYTFGPVLDPKEQANR